MAEEKGEKRRKGSFIRVFEEKRELELQPREKTLGPTLRGKRGGGGGKSFLVEGGIILSVMTTGSFPGQKGGRGDTSTGSFRFY